VHQNEETGRKTPAAPGNLQPRPQFLCLPSLPWFSFFVPRAGNFGDALTESVTMQQFKISARQRANQTERTKCDPFVEFITTIAAEPVSVEMLLRRTEWVFVGLARLQTIESGFEELELDWNADLARLTKFDPDSLDRETDCMPLKDFRELVIEWRNIVLQRWRNPR
jgi:hypothetical protein